MGWEHGCAKLAGQLAVTRCLEVVKMPTQMCLNLTLSLGLCRAPARLRMSGASGPDSLCVHELSEFQETRGRVGAWLGDKEPPGHQGLFRFSPVGKHVRFFILFLWTSLVWNMRF